MSVSSEFRLLAFPEKLKAILRLARACFCAKSAKCRPTLSLLKSEGEPQLNVGLRYLC